MSIVISGKCVGVKRKENINNQTGEVKIHYRVGVATPKLDGFADEVDIAEIKIHEDFMKSGAQSTYEALKGKRVSLAVIPRSWAMNGKHGISWSFEQITPLLIDGKKPL